MKKSYAERLRIVALWSACAFLPIAVLATLLGVASGDWSADSLIMTGFLVWPVTGPIIGALACAAFLRPSTHESRFALWWRLAVVAVLALLASPFLLLQLPTGPLKIILIVGVNASLPPLVVQQWAQRDRPWPRPRDMVS